MNKTPWYRWPENKETGMLPWFLLLRRAIFYPFFLLGISIAFLAIFLAAGSEEAFNFWRWN